MPACEKCWGQSYLQSRLTGEDRVELYSKLIDKNNCTPEEQAGEDANVCPDCNRKTMHIYVKTCMNPECKEEKDG